MIIEFDRSFEKSLDKIGDKSILPRIERLILKLEKAQSLNEIRNIRKLSGFKDYFRIRILCHPCDQLIQVTYNSMHPSPKSYT